MARFEKFGDYAFSLLTAPLKRGKQAANQFFIFFKVVGTLAVVARSAAEYRFSLYPLCGTVKCGAYPSPSNAGHLVSAAIAAQSAARAALHRYPIAGATLASEKFYQEIWIHPQGGSEVNCQVQ